MDIVQQEADRLYKTHFGKMVASLLYFSSAIDIETAEDLVQDAFSAALTHWTTNGIPSNAAGWLFKVCRNKALNKIKEDKRFKTLFEQDPIHTAEITINETVFDDQQLRLLFACAHPHLSPKVQVVITLKYVVNLKVEAIAKILAMTIDGIDKLLVRARQKIKDEKLLLQEPPLSALQLRLAMVHKILYLVFNEGYKSSWGKELIREELCEDALLMTKTLVDSRISNQDTSALYALMLFNAARFKSRFGAEGQLLDMEEQDRSMWNQDLIFLATHFLKKAGEGSVSSYHYEASIAYLHCDAVSFEYTDWATISKLYAQLLKDNANPFIELNYAIALYYAGKKETAFSMLHQLHQNSFFNQYYLLNATLGRLYFLEGHYAKATTFFNTTLTQTNFQAEKDFINRMIDKIKSKDS